MRPQLQRIHHDPDAGEHEHRGPAHGPGIKPGIFPVPAQLEHVGEGEDVANEAEEEVAPARVGVERAPG